MTNFKYNYSMRVFGSLVCRHDFPNNLAKAHVNANLQSISDSYNAGISSKDAATILAGLPIFKGYSMDAI